MNTNPFQFNVANQIWTDISGLNAKVEEHFRQLSELHDSDSAAYNNAIKTLSNSRYDAWTATSKIEEKMVALANDFMKLRGMLRELTELSGVPIEPKEQTQLLDACMNVPGVVMAGVPGGKYEKNTCPFYIYIYILTLSLLISWWI